MRQILLNVLDKLRHRTADLTGTYPKENCSVTQRYRKGFKLD